MTLSPQLYHKCSLTLFCKSIKLFGGVSARHSLFVIIRLRLFHHLFTRVLHVYIAGGFVEVRDTQFDLNSGGSVCEDSTQTAFGVRCLTNVSGQWLR